MAAERLKRELFISVEELKKVTRKVENYLNSDSELEYRVFLCTLKESSIHLNKLLSRIKNTKLKVDSLPEQFSVDVNLDELLDSALSAELNAEAVLSKLEAKLEINVSNVPVVPCSPSVNECKSYVKPPSDKIEMTKVSGDIDFIPDLINVDEKGINRNHTDQNILSAEDIVERLNAIDLSSISASVLHSAHPAKPMVKSKKDKEINVNEEENVPKPFELTIFSGNPTQFPLFWEEYQRTVNISPLEIKYKFSALRSLIRSEPYRLFLDLNYSDAMDYQKALNRLFDKYANDELKQKKTEDESTVKQLSTISPYCTNAKVCKKTFKVWSDEYFVKRYCNAVLNFKKPRRGLLIEVIHAFLNLYISGSSDLSNVEYIWLILMHGVKFDNEYMVDSMNTKIFGNNEVDIPTIATVAQCNLHKYAPHFLKQKEECRPKDKLWTWKFTTGTGKSKKEVSIIPENVKKWYKFWWDAASTDDHTEFQNCVNYFALLSMVLFRATVKQRVSVENYIPFSFNESFRGLKDFNYYIPDTPPPHSRTYKIIDETFKRNGQKFKMYLTYLVGCYTFANTASRNQIRAFLNAGCLQSLSAVGTGSIYFLRRSAKRRSMKPEDLLMYFSVDPSLRNHIEKITKFMESYKKQITWWWARLFENYQLKEISTAYCPIFAFACYVIGTFNKTEIVSGKSFSQFSRFISDTATPNMTGETLGLMIKNMIIEFQSTPSSYLMQALHKRRELQKCNEKETCIIPG